MLHIIDNYQFVKIPLNLFNCLDNNCRSVLYSLIQLSSYYAKDDGWFYRSNDDLGAQCNLSKNVLSGALDALYIHGIIDVHPAEKGRGVKQTGRKYKVLFDSFRMFEDISIEDTIKNPEYKICTCDYKKSTVPSFQRKLESQQTFEQGSQPTLSLSSRQTSSPTSLQSDNNIDNVKNTYNIENIEEIYNKILLNKESVIEEGLTKLDNELYSTYTLDILDRNYKEFCYSFKYFDSNEFQGRRKFYEIVSSDSSISLDNVEELLKFLVRAQASHERKDKEPPLPIPTNDSAPALNEDDFKNEVCVRGYASVSFTEAEEEVFNSSLFKYIDDIARTGVNPTQLERENASFAQAVDACVDFYGYEQDKAERYIRMLTEGYKSLSTWAS